MTRTAPTVEHAREHLERGSTALLDIAMAGAGEDSLVWAAKVEKAARSLGRALQEHKELTEAEEGSLAEIVAEKPALSEEVDGQIREHENLLHRNARLVADCERARAFEDTGLELLQIDSQILALMVRRHMSWESMMLREAFFREEGGRQG